MKEQIEIFIDGKEIEYYELDSYLKNIDCITKEDGKWYIYTKPIEDKKIEKISKSYNIRILDLDKPHTIKDYDMEQLIEMVQDIYEKQDEIIDYINKEK